MKKCGLDMERLQPNHGISKTGNTVAKNALRPIVVLECLLFFTFLIKMREVAKTWAGGNSSCVCVSCSKTHMVQKADIHHPSQVATEEADNGLRIRRLDRHRAGRWATTTIPTASGTYLRAKTSNDFHIIDLPCCPPLSDFEFKRFGAISYSIYPAAVIFRGRSLEWQSQNSDAR